MGGIGVVLTTTDFTQSEQQQLAFGDREPDWLEGIAYGKGHWVIVGRQHAVWSSTDGLVWEDAFTTGMTFAADTFYDVVFDGSYFWLCGNGGVLLQSQLVEGGGTTPGPANLAVRVGDDPATLVLRLQGRQGDQWNLEYAPTLSPTASWELRQSVSLDDGTAEVIESKGAGGFYRLKSPAGP